MIWGFNVKLSKRQSNRTRIRSIGTYIWVYRLTWQVAKFVQNRTQNCQYLHFTRCSAAQKLTWLTSCQKFTVLHDWLVSYPCCNHPNFTLFHKWDYVCLIHCIHTLNQSILSAKLCFKLGIPVDVNSTSFWTTSLQQ